MVSTRPSNGQGSNPTSEILFFFYQEVIFELSIFVEELFALK